MGINDHIPNKHPLLESLGDVEAAAETLPEAIQTAIKDIHNKAEALLGDSMTGDTDKEEIIALEKQLVDDASWATCAIATELAQLGELDVQTTDRGRELEAANQKILKSMECIPAFKTGIWS